MTKKIDLNETEAKESGYWFEKRKLILVVGILVLLVVVGTGLRTINLGVPSFWIDELNHFYAGKSILEGKGPLLPSGWPYTLALPYTYCVAFSMKILGEGEFACRFPSALFGSLAIPFVFWIGYKSFNVKVGLISALFITFFPFEIGWSRVCRMYTIFQFLFLWGFYTFYLGFEKRGKGIEREISKINESRFWSGLKNFISEWGISWKWLFLSGVILLFSFYIQHLTALFLISMMCYWGMMATFSFFQHGYIQGLKSKYFWFFSSSIFLSAAVWIVSPALRSKVIELSQFYPFWAQHGGAGDKFTYLDFLISNIRFPLGALLLIGAIQAVLRLNRAGFYTLISCGVPFILHSFFFKTKVDRYIFNIFPLFLIIASYGLTNLIDMEIETAKRTFKNYTKLNKLISNEKLNILVILIMFSWLPFTRWFYNSFEIPTIRSGPGHLGGLYTNGAVTHEDWREACGYIKKHLEPNDVIITTQTLTTLYYLGKVDFSIYGGDLGTMHEVKRNGDYELEPYADIPVLKNVESLKKTIIQNCRGWLLFDFFRFEFQIPDEVVEYVQKNLTLHNNNDSDGTIYIYSWGID